MLGLRFRSGLGFGGRSFCPSCGKKLLWWELLPVLSYALLRGKCSNCHSKISPQYPLVELWTGVLFVSLYSVYGFSIQYVISLIIFCLYTVILIYDLRHKIIPDSLVYLSIFISLIFRLYSGGSVSDWIAGPVFFAIFGSIWLFSKGRVMGFGDAKLVLSIGLLLGSALGTSALVVAFWVGALLSIALMLFYRKGITMKTEIPFAPFLIFGAWLSLVFSLDLFYVHQLLS